MNIPKVVSDGNGGTHVQIQGMRPDHVKFGIGAGVIVTVTLLIVNLIFSVGARSNKYETDHEMLKDHEARMREVEKAVADMPRIKDNTDAIKEMLKQHIRDSR
jgi:uncharacterized membrane protein (DUF106 family)